jgi:glycosyltransferase involved in cell wall biosynthesis
VAIPPAQPVVSVVVPSFNRFDSLLAALSSVRASTYPCVEIIVVDDGSTSPDYVAHDFGDSRIIHLGEQNNSRNLFGFPSVGHVRNIGMMASTGEYIAFIDDSDWFLPAKLAMQVAVMIQTGCKMSSTNGYIGQLSYAAGRVPPEDEFLGWIHLPSRYGGHFIAKRNLIICSSVVVHRSVLFTAGPFATIPLNQFEDYEYWKRILVTEQNCHLKDGLVYYRNNKNGSVRSGSVRIPRAPVILLHVLLLIIIFQTVIIVSN